MVSTLVNQTRETRTYDRHTPSHPLSSSVWIHQPRARPDWQHSLLTGNGTLGAMVPGNPFEVTIYLSHAALYLPSPEADQGVQMAPHLGKFQDLCLSGKYEEAGLLIDELRDAESFTEERDRFIAAFALKVQQPEAEVKAYKRSVKAMSAETCVSVETEAGLEFNRSLFASRETNLLVFRLKGNQPLSATLSFGVIPTVDEMEEEVKQNGIAKIEQGTWEGFLRYRTDFAVENETNPLLGYEGLGRVITRGGTTEATDQGVVVSDAEEVLLLIAIRPQLKGEDALANREEIKTALLAVDADYNALVQAHQELHADLMGRVSLTLGVSDEERNQPTEELFTNEEDPAPSLSRIERAFAAGRYNIISSTGYHPPNLQGLWSGTWLAPWYGSFTTNGNLPCAIAFLLMGNTPELMHSWFDYCDARWDGFRQNAKEIFGMPGFHIPAQCTLTPRETNYGQFYPHPFSHASAPWALQFYYDYAQMTGDETFLKEKAYPLMKECASFFEAFAAKKDENGHRIFAPSYSPENYLFGKRELPTTVNAAMDVGVCRQLLRNCISTAERFGCDAEDVERWTTLLNELLPYETNDEGFFREWLWKDLPEHNDHRHASHLYELYDEMPEEILSDPELVKGIANTIRARIDFHKRVPVMSFGLVQVGLAAARIGRADLAQEVIERLADHYWTTGMGSFHDGHNLFNTDISGGFPYLCASCLVYGGPGRIVFFPALPERWTSGSLKGVRLRGCITVKELTWADGKATAVLVADHDQTITVDTPGQDARQVALVADKELTLDL